jgi:cysteinyl-tRNA synthetase
MAEKELGFGFDIHGGGLDLIFPHHENELTQSEAAAGDEPFVRYWLHNGMVRLKGEKMAKSTGNVVGLIDLLDAYPPLAVRLFYLRAHYRQPIDFGPDAIEDASASLERLWSFRRRVEADRGRSVDPGGSGDPAAIVAFREAMDDDFNTARALGVLFEVVREGNRRLDEGGDAAPQAAVYDVIMGVLGLLESATSLDDVAEKIALIGEAYAAAGATAELTVGRLIEKRTEARDAREWAVADDIRDRLAEVGVVIEDRSDGTVWHRR